MTTRRAVLVGVAAALAVGSSVHAGGPGGVGPATIPGERRVSTRDGAGNLSTTWDIPGESLFTRHGGAASPCRYSYRVDVDGDRLSDETRLAESMMWVFEQVTVWPDSEVQAFTDAVNLSFDPDWQPVADGFARFRVGCRGNWYGVANADWFTDWFQYGDVDVAIVDPFFWRRSVLDQLRAGLSLVRPVVSSPPSLARWGGVAVRSPVWLSIGGAAWRVQSSATVASRGVELAVVAIPASLVFDVSYRPAADGIGVAPPEVVTVPCLAGFGAVGGEGGHPGVPGDLPEWSGQLGVAGDCTWVPPGRGEVTVVARVMFDVFDWVSGFTAPQAPYVWESAPVTWQVGELRSVNVYGASR